MNTNEKNSPAGQPPASSKPLTDEALLKVVKEIVIKFIEVGRLTIPNFDETFRQVYHTVHDTVRPDRPDGA